MDDEQVWPSLWLTFTSIKILQGSQPFSFKVVCLFPSANYGSLVEEKSVRFLKS